MKAQAPHQHNRQRKTTFAIEKLETMPSADKAAILQEQKDYWQRVKGSLKETGTGNCQYSLRPSSWRLHIGRLKVLKNIVRSQSASPVFYRKLMDIIGQHSIEALVQLSVSSIMTSECMRRIHAAAQEISVQSKLEGMVSETIALCNKKGDWWNYFKGSKFAGYRLELSNLAIHGAARRVFKLEGFKNIMLSSIIREPLWPTSRSAEAGLLKRTAIRIGVFTGFTALYTLIDAALETMFFVSTLVINSLGLVSRTYVSLDKSSMLYDDQRVEEKHVRAALLYYFKIRLQVFATLTKRLDRTEKISQMEPILAKVMVEYCYRRDRKLWRKPSWTTAEADTEQSTEP